MLLGEEDVNVKALLKLYTFRAIPEYFITQSLSLVRSIQLWDAVNPGRDFENSTLQRPQADLWSLKAIDTAKTQDILKRARQCLMDSFYNDADYHHDLLRPFWESLSRNEPTMHRFIFPSSPNDPFHSSFRIDQSFCHGQPDRLIFHIPEFYASNIFPFSRTITCPNEAGKVVLELIGAIDSEGGLINFGAGVDSPYGEGVYEMARYAGLPSVDIVNTLIIHRVDPQKVFGEKLLYMYRIDEQRFRSIKSAATSALA